MMTTTRTNQTGLAVGTPPWQEAVIALSLGEGRLLLNDGSTARQAASCLVVPQPGDVVLWVQGSDGERYVLHLLTRRDVEVARITMPATKQLLIEAPKVTLKASEQLALTSLRDAELTAAGGRLSLTALNLSMTVIDSLLQSARHVVGRCENWLMTARGLGRLHGRQTMVTADEDIRADAERISLG